MPESEPRLVHLREVQGVLQRLLTRVQRDVEQGQTETLVAVGQELWHVANLAKRALRQIKRHLRGQVRPVAGTHRVFGTGGASCQVTVPTPTVIIREGTDMDALMRKLGSETFYRLFEVRPVAVPKPDFQEAVLDLDKATSALVMGAVDIRAGKFRVSFATNNGGHR